MGLELKFEILKEAAKVAETHPEVFIEALKKVAYEEKILRASYAERYKFVEIADSWCDIPESVRNYKTGSFPADFTSTLGSHYQNKRFAGGYHIHTDIKGGPAKLHFDAIDPMKSPLHGIPHWIAEATFDYFDYANGP